jgi:hypothetical protein
MNSLPARKALINICLAIYQLYINYKKKKQKALFRKICSQENGVYVINLFIYFIIYYLFYLFILLFIIYFIYLFIYFILFFFLTKVYLIYINIYLFLLIYFDTICTVTGTNLNYFPIVAPTAIPPNSSDGGV